MPPRFILGGARNIGSVQLMGGSMRFWQCSSRNVMSARNAPGPVWLRSKRYTSWPQEGGTVALVLAFWP